MANVLDINKVSNSRIFEVSDFTSIQSAINAAESNGGGLVLLEPKIYIVDEPLIIDSSGVTLKGMNRNISKIISSANDVEVLRVGSESTSDSGKVQFCKIVDIGFENTASSTTYCVRVFGTTYFIMRDSSITRGTTGLVMRNCDMASLENNLITTDASGAISVDLQQGASDDITTCKIVGGQINVDGTNGIGLKMTDAPGDGSSNEFNNLYLGSIKFDGTNTSGTVGIDIEAGTRNTTIQNCEFKEFRAADIDASTNLDDGKKVFFTVDSCKMLGNSSNRTLKKIILKEPSASGSKTKFTMRGAGTQFHRFVDGIYVSAGSPNIYLEDMDASTGTNLIEVASGATPAANPNITCGDLTIGGSVTNNRGTNLIASSANYAAGIGNAFGSFTLQDEGSVTVNSGATTASISWSLDFTPNDRDIYIIPDDDDGGDVGEIWLSSVSASGATLNVTTAPSGSNKTFRYKVKAG